jgi:predicted molibdopterin-dependent oxidoreductase YjgC
MVKIRINNKEIEAPENSTIMEIAHAAGYSIPSLCHKNGLPHYSSCMVCMVKETRKNTFLPSCSALVQEGMDIDVSGEEVVSMRKKSVELLLSEHRAECEAPCRIVCPAGYNIPLMNRYLTDRNFNGAYELVASEIKSAEIKCIDCPGYCENACRRKKIDLPISIRNMKLYITDEIRKTIQLEKLPETTEKKKRSDRPFTSKTGKLESEELNEWLKECIAESKRFREISDVEYAYDESANCMHCDCRAMDNCRLRDLAQAFSIKDTGNKVTNAPVEKKINPNTGLIFENAKCIKCGLCVRVCEDSTDEPALCFMHRGFVSIISEPLTEDFNSVLKTKSQLVIDICPTGALSRFK